MSVLEMAAGVVEGPLPVTDPSLDIRVLQRPTLVQPKVPKPLQGNPAEANRNFNKEFQRLYPLKYIENKKNSMPFNHIK